MKRTLIALLIAATSLLPASGMATPLTPEPNESREVLQKRLIDLEAAKPRLTVPGTVAGVGAGMILLGFAGLGWLSSYSLLCVLAGGAVGSIGLLMVSGQAVEFDRWSEKVKATREKLDHLGRPPVPVAAVLRETPPPPTVGVPLLVTQF